MIPMFVRSDLDDYGLDPYEFRIYGRIARRAGPEKEAWESIPKMARGCQMSESRARKALQLLEAARLIESVERPGHTTIRLLTPRQNWVAPEELEIIRASLIRTKSITPSKSDSGSKTDTPVQSETGVVSDLSPLPVSEVIGESNPLKGNPIKILPLDTTNTEEDFIGGEVKFLIEAEDEASTDKSIAKVSELPKLTIPVLESPERTQLLTELSQLTSEPLESLRLNTCLTSALDRYRGNVKNALAYLKQAIATWKKRPGIGLFISAVKNGQKPSLNQPGSEWKEWADESIRRKLMSHSEKCNDDIRIYFKNGVQRLWSEVRSLSWSEIEALALSNYQELVVDYAGDSARTEVEIASL